MQRVMIRSRASGIEGSVARGGGGRLGHPGVQLIDGALGAARARAAEKEVVQDQPEGVDVRALIDRLRPRLLGSHVRDGADHAFNLGVSRGHVPADHAPGLALPRRARLGGVGGARHAEVHDQAFAVGVDHDVGGLEVPVDDAGRVGGDEAGRDAPRDLHHAGHGQLALAFQDRRQLLALEERHRDVLDAAHVAHVVHPHDVLVRDPAGEQQLLLEPALEHARRLGIRGHLRANRLQGDDNLEDLVPGLVDRTHAAGAEQLENLVAETQLLPDEIAGRVPKGARRR